MHQDLVTSDFAGAITRYFVKANLPTQRGTLGETVTETLRDRRNLSRESFCTKLFCRLEQATGEGEQRHYNILIGLLFGQYNSLIVQQASYEVVVKTSDNESIKYEITDQATLQMLRMKMDFSLQTSIKQLLVMKSARENTFRRDLVDSITHDFSNSDIGGSSRRTAVADNKSMFTGKKINRIR